MRPSDQSARDLWLAAVDRNAAADVDSALVLYRAAIRRDAGFLPAHLDYLWLMRQLGRSLSARGEYDAAWTVGTERGACLRALAWSMTSHDAPEAISRIRLAADRYGPTPCLELARRFQLPDTASGRAELLVPLVQRYPASHLILGKYSIELAREGQSRRGVQVLRHAVSVAPSSATEILLRVQLVWLFQNSMDTSAARREITSLSLKFRTQGRPFLSWLVRDPNLSRLLRSAPGGVVQSGLRLARSHNARHLEFSDFVLFGRFLYDAGDLRGAAALLGHATKIADATGSPDYALQAYLARGRVRARQGDTRNAIEDLHKARAAARALGERYSLADIYHHLAHAHESAGAWREAVAAADSFVKYGSDVGDPPMRMIRLNDAGMIRWNAGYRVAADSFFRLMVAEIESARANYTYAGAYFLRIGDLPRALRYHRLEYELEGGERKRPLAGLVRVHSELGQFDTAAVLAAIHDSLAMPPDDELLLPDILNRLGNRVHATRIMHQWAREQRRRGNPRATAIAMTKLAEFVVWDDPARARAYADSALQLARSVRYVEGELAARAAGAVAAARLGATDRAIAELGDIARESRPRKNVLFRATVLAAGGDILSRANRFSQSLAWYARAADAANQTAGDFDDDVFAARFRDARKAVFDGAALAALRLAPSERVHSLVEWSQRKKASPVAFGVQRPVPLTLGRIQASLDARTAVVDFLILGDTAVAIVVTRRSARVVPLAVKPAELGELARRLSAPLRDIRGGRLDLARASYPLDAAYRLYLGLLRPVEELLAGVDELVIVPDAPIYSVVFDALVTSSPERHLLARDYRSAAYVLDRWRVRLAPSLAGFSSVESRGVGVGVPVLVVTSPSPGDDREVREISRAWGSAAVRVLRGPAATESALLSAGRYKLLHVTSHAVSDDFDPLRSHIKLARDRRTDGLLHATEITAARLRADLVVLSSCESAAGEQFSGTGALSLARAFLAGGARSVIATQWPVGETAAVLSGRLHTSLARGQTVSASLHAAKSALRHDRATAHPFYWASYVLLGR